jgi:hypothetical protein
LSAVLWEIGRLGSVQDTADVPAGSPVESNLIRAVDHKPARMRERLKVVNRRQSMSKEDALISDGVEESSGRALAFGLCALLVDSTSCVPAFDD